MLYFHPKFPIFWYHYNYPFSLAVTRYVFAPSFIYNPCFKKISVTFPIFKSIKLDFVFLLENSIYLHLL